MSDMVFDYPRIAVGMGAANDRRNYIITSSLIGWAHTQNDPWYRKGNVVFHFFFPRNPRHALWFDLWERIPTKKTNNTGFLLATKISHAKPIPELRHGCWSSWRASQFNAWVLGNGFGAIYLVWYENIINHQPTKLFKAVRLNKMAYILQMTSSCPKTLEFWLTFHWDLFSRVQST